MDYVVYILRSQRDGSLYVGQTNNLERRLAQHNRVTAKSYTAKRGPWTLAYAEQHPTRAEAADRERFLKSTAGAHEKRRLAGQE